MCLHRDGECSRRSSSRGAGSFRRLSYWLGDVTATAAKSCLGSVTPRYYTEGARGAPIELNANTIIMGVESTADDTGIALMDTSGRILGESLKTQFRRHRQNVNGGIWPALAQQLHDENLPLATDEALERAGVKLSDVSVIAYAKGPGMPYSLDSGCKWCRELHSRHGTPLLPVNHMHAHALTARLVPDADVSFPFLVLLASGGHCTFAVAESVSQFKILGTNLVWTPGQVIDKISSKLRLRFSPELEHLSQGAALEAAARRGNPSRFPFERREKQRYNRTCFSNCQPFYLEVLPILEALDTGDTRSPVPEYEDLAASFQAHLCQYLTLKAEHAIRFAKHCFPSIRHFVVSGGVASNLLLREMLSSAVQRQAPGWQLVAPPPRLCTDNGVMIAWAGVEYLKAGIAPLTSSEAVSMRYHPRLYFGEDISARYAEFTCRIKRPKVPGMQLSKSVP